MPETYTVHISDPASSFDITLDSPRPTGLTPLIGEIAGPGSFYFTLGQYDPQTAGIVVWATEVRVYRGTDPDPCFVGPIIEDRVDFNAATVTFKCADLSEHIYHRLIDRGPGRSDLLDGDGEFEVGALGDPPTNWTVVPDPVLTGLTAELDDTWKAFGTQSVKLTQPDPGADAYIKKTFTITAAPDGAAITVKAFCRIDGASWAGPALEQWGMVLRQTVGGVPVQSEEGWKDSNKITSDTPRDADLRFEDVISVLGSVTADIEVDFYAPAGVTWYDYAGAFLMESLSLLGQDQATIAGIVILFLQSADANAVAEGRTDKSDLNITVDTPATGVIRSKTWQYADHTPGNVALSELTGLDDGIEYGIGPDRVFRTYFPQRGTDRSATVTLIPDTNCTLQTRTFDGQSAASQVTQGWLGDGPDREEQGASDPSAFGGVTLQKYLPPRGTPGLDTLAASAARALAIAKVPIVYEATIFDPALQATLELGDIVAAGWDLGYVQEAGNVRIITYARVPDTDSLVVQLVPVV